MKDPLPLTTAVARTLERVVDGDLDDDCARRSLAAHTWSCLVEPGDGVAGRLVSAVGYEDALAAVAEGASGARAVEAAGIGPREWADALGRWRPRLEPDRIRHALEAAARAGVSLLTPADARWPRALADLGHHAPLVLWVRGDAGVLDAGLSIALVGARAATGYGEHVAMELSADLAARGATIVSGAAYGIDGAAHRAALAAGGITVALLAGGADRPYPAGHAGLIGRIVDSGAVVSEVPCGSEPTKWRFLQRNRLIAALSKATVVVEAGWRSGTLNTAGHAAALSRPLGAVPGPVTSAASAGCHRILREYDARCITNADDVLELAGALSPALFDLPVDQADAERTDDVTRVRDAMSFRSWRRLDDIGRRAGIGVDDVSAILGLLALDGAVERGEEGWRRRRPGAASR